MGLDSLDNRADKERNIYKDLQTYVPFMALPSLVDFTLGDGLGMPVGKLPFYTEIEDGDKADSKILRIKVPVARDTSTIRSLSLLHQSIDTRILQRILALPHRLETFSYSVDDGLTRFVPKSIAQGLSPHAHCLTVLTLNESYWTKIDGSVLGSLKPFQVLHTLSVSVTTLLGHSTTHSCSPTNMALTNPLDALLPCSLVTINLKLWDKWKVCDLLVVTGLPYTMEKTRVTLPSLKTFTIDRKGTRYRVDETELSGIKQATDMIPDLLLLLESNEITMTPPLVAGQLLCFPLPSVNAEQVLNQWMGWNHSRIHQIIQRSHTTVSHLALLPNFVQLFLLCPPSWYMYSDHPPHQVAYSAILLSS